MVKTSTLVTQVVDGKNARLEIESAELKVVTGPDRGLIHRLTADSVLIGTGPSCDLVLTDPTVSSRHAEISLGDRGYLVRDLGSTNGIVSGSVAIERALLSDGMKLQFGDTAIAVRSLKTNESVPLGAVGQFGQLVAHSVKMRALAALIERVAPTESTVLIEGETGTGKERVAQTLHDLSRRRNGPFVVFDCSAVQPSLAVAEPFGHEKGAFTGADRVRRGLLAEADGGTLFLDEIGELSTGAQPLLSRVIESKLSRPLGAKADVRHDVRIIAATNRNLAEEVRAKRFRGDLYHRLAVIRMRVPPLRERREDIPVLADMFAAEVGITLEAEAMHPFASYEWPGNVRELRNVVSRSAAQGKPPRPASWDEIDASGVSLPEARKRAVEDFERDYLRRLMASTGGNLSRAAELAGITRQSLTSLVEKHGLRTRK